MVAAIRQTIFTVLLTFTLNFYKTIFLRPLAGLLIHYVAKDDLEQFYLPSAGTTGMGHCSQFTLCWELTPGAVHPRPTEVHPQIFNSKI